VDVEVNVEVNVPVGGEESAASEWLVESPQDRTSRAHAIGAELARRTERRRRFSWSAARGWACGSLVMRL